MKQAIICCPRRGKAVEYAAGQLSSLGLTVTDTPGPDVTHLLLPVPSFPDGDGCLHRLLGDLSPEVLVVGGGLDLPALVDHRVVDFLKDPYYLAENAAITADCAIAIARRETGTSLSGLPVLVLGWGRIGKCLGKQLEKAGADVAIAARRDADLAMIRALGHHALRISDASDAARRFRVLFNTVPAMILPELTLAPGAIALELASRPGMSGSGILPARGLPGRLAPERAGDLMARSFIRLAL